MFYSWDLLPSVAMHIEQGRSSEIRRSTGLLLVAIDNPNADLFRLRCAQCMSAFLRGARRAGAPSDALLAEHLASLARLAALQDHERMRRHVQRYALRLSRQVCPPATVQIERTIAGMLTDMEKALERPKSLGHYAHDLEISTGHLSRSFSRIVGRSFREEQRRLRDLHACDLLRSTSLVLSQVARRVGMMSTSQFIADFRKAHGITPACYRRMQSPG
jgi:AraC-like DNA-binding protein